MRSATAPAGVLCRPVCVNKQRKEDPAMRASRRRFISVAASSGAGMILAPALLNERALSAAPSFQLNSEGPIIEMPYDPSQIPAFREALQQWRKETKAKLKYDDALYRRPEFAWSTSNYSCCF